MTLEAKCQLCGDKICYEPNKVSLLADHFCFDHPDEDVGYFSVLNFSIYDDENFEESSQMNVELRKIYNEHGGFKIPSTTTVFTYQKSSHHTRARKSEDTLRPCNQQEDETCPTCPSCYSINYFGNRKKRYKTTVESWTQGPKSLVCPRCGRCGLPMIRRQRNKIAKSSLGALCLLGCWPLCFLPFMLGGSNIMNLYCRHCGSYLATYDRHCGQIKKKKSSEIVKVPNVCE